jgi:hypothetical protein
MPSTAPDATDKKFSWPELTSVLALQGHFSYHAPRRPCVKKLNLALALAAGFAGGALSHYLVPPAIQAETPVAPTELRARSFLLVNEKGAVRGTFALDSNGRPALRLFDVNGREVWSAEMPSVRPATGR